MDVALILPEIVNPDCEWSDPKIGELPSHPWCFRPAKTASLKVFDGLLCKSRMPELTDV
jgi:hypothetical protein